jgi:hypothetical protein
VAEKPVSAEAATAAAHSHRLALVKPGGQPRRENAQQSELWHGKYPYFCI